ncbi:hypothetical protein [Pseudomonas sp. LA5]|uniref:hypothetical protein n=1 Tax=Pseudomonas sp. LA5 TaxID=3027850 RepID=UPI002360B128|nr:hypothetical protein [Pseudomonas sp. LA5]
MTQKNHVLTAFLSAITLLGPLAYILFGFSEYGRLSYLGAPTGFIQITSLPIIPMITNIYPPLFLIIITSTIAYGVRVTHTSQRYVLCAMTIFYLCAGASYLSLTTQWQWAFGIISVASAIVALLINGHYAEIGNELDTPNEHAIANFDRYRKTAKYILFGSIGIFVFVAIFFLSGKKEASRQAYYWVASDSIVLGFYGETTLIGKISNNDKISDFELVETKSMKKPIALLKIGPLHKAATWQESTP